MRPLAGADRIRALVSALGREASEPTAVYLTDGATAVLLGWRETTVDVDLRFEPERDELLRAVARLKDELRINVELASPADFIPVPDGVEGRAVRDLADVAAMVRARLVDPAAALRYLVEIEPHRFPAIDPAEFRRRGVQAFGGGEVAR